MNYKNYTILIVDDKPENLKVLGNLLNEYDIKISLSGSKALDIISKNKIDLILLDVMMPELDGYKICKILKENEMTNHIPIIFLSARTGIKDEEYGLSLGAVDYITKPISPSIIKTRIKAHLATSEYQSYLEKEILIKTKRINNISSVFIDMITLIMEYKDQHIFNKIYRIKNYMEILTKNLAMNEKYKHILIPEYIALIIKSVILYEMIKESKSLDKEFDDLLSISKENIILEDKNNFIKNEKNLLSIMMEIEESYDEKWNGNGYPKGLVGTQIPIQTRLLALVSRYEQLSSEMVFDNDEIEFLIINKKGIDFDPDIVEEFKNSLIDFKKIRL